MNFKVDYYQTSFEERRQRHAFAKSENERSLTDAHAQFERIDADLREAVRLADKATIRTLRRHHTKVLRQISMYKECIKYHALWEDESKAREMYLRELMRQ